MDFTESETNLAPSVLEGRDIVCFSNDWKGDPLSKTHIMRLLAKKNRILWVNSLGNRAPRPTLYDFNRIAAKIVSAFGSIEEVEANIHVMTPFALPVLDSRVVRELNRISLEKQIRRAMRQLNFSRPIVWAFLPSAECVAQAIKPDILVYHCVDEFSAFSDAPSKIIQEAEARLAKVSDIVITSAERLFHKKKQYNANTILVRHGVDHAHFSKTLEIDTPIPNDIAYLPRPILGFFGLIADWVDIELIRKVGRAQPEGSVVLIGKVRTDVSILEAENNIYVLGQKPYKMLPSYAKAFDVALMPFKINELTLNSNPLKAREYLAAGLPVVSTSIPEVVRLGLCKIAADHEEFLVKVEEALAESHGPAFERSESVRKESWEARLEEICAHLKLLEALRAT